jgi:hypothetical protein
MIIGWTNLNHFDIYVKYFIKLDPAYCMQVCFVVLQGTHSRIKGAINENRP